MRGEQTNQIDPPRAPVANLGPYLKTDGEKQLDIRIDLPHMIKELKLVKSQ